MEWLNGNLEEALSNARSHDFIFLVFIDGNNELSEQLLSFFTDETICNRITQNDIKVLRISNGTESFQKFVTTYRTVPVPSMFLIDRFGEPIDLITSDISSVEALAEKLDRVIIKMRPILELIAPHLDLTTESAYDRAYVTQISTSSVSSNEESNEYCIDNSEELQRVFPKEANPSQVENMVYEVKAFDRMGTDEEVHSYLEGGQDIGNDSPQSSTVTFSKFQKEFKVKNSKVSHPPLANLIFRFESGETRSQFFSHTTPFSTVRQYITQVLKRESDFKDFYVSTTFPSRVLVPELDKASLQDLGLYPSAMINVHFSEEDRQRNLVLSERKSVMEQIGGLTSVVLIVIWTILNPIMVGTNWLGLRDYLIADEDVEEYGGFLSNIFSFQGLIDD